VKDTNVKKLLKILIGAAWLDGKIQPEERQYLQRVAREENLATDPEIQPLLYELRAIQPTELDAWVREYLGDRPDTEACQNLLQAISGLIYSDGEVATEEAKMLTELQLTAPASGEPQSGHNAVLNQIKKLYRRWVVSQS
jgi:uncharacterized tellurite resistance protein B-like protein